MRFYTFGIGDDCDKDLVVKMAKGGRGTHYIIGDDRSHLVSSKVIDALSKSFEPSISNCSITIEYGDYIDWQELGEIHENELISRQFNKVFTFCATNVWQF